MWGAIKGITKTTISSFRSQPPLEVEEACTLLVQHAKNKDVDAMEAIIKRNKAIVNEIINAKELVCHLHTTACKHNLHYT
jgi:hypothetical protein